MLLIINTAEYKDFDIQLHGCSSNFTRNKSNFTNNFTKTFIFHMKFTMNSYEVVKTNMKFMKGI